jgi:hypothetical protein
MSSSLAAVVRALADAPGAAPTEDRAAERDTADARAEVEVFEVGAERLYARKLVGRVDLDSPIGALLIVESDRRPDICVPGYAIAWVPTGRTSTRGR